MKLSLSEKQLTLLNFARANDNKITKKQAVELLGNYYYYNAAKYVGEILCRMVNNNSLVRLKPGMYQISTCFAGNKSEVIAKNQIKLF